VSKFSAISCENKWHSDVMTLITGLC